MILVCLAGLLGLSCGCFFFLFCPLFVLLGERSDFDSLGFLLRHLVFLRKSISFSALRRIPLLKTVFSSVKRS